jgi:hypothetical protein
MTYYHDDFGNTTTRDEGFEKREHDWDDIHYTLLGQYYIY